MGSVVVVVVVVEHILALVDTVVAVVDIDWEDMLVERLDTLYQLRHLYVDGKDTQTSSVVQLSSRFTRMKVLLLMVRKESELMGYINALCMR